MAVLKGIAASPGIAIGKAFVYKRSETEIQDLKATDIKTELQKFEKALGESEKQLREIEAKTAQEIGKNEAAIFASHLLILNDPSLIKQVVNNIKEKGLRGEAAVQDTTNKFVELFDNMQDPYFRARAADVQDVGNRILNNMRGLANNFKIELDKQVIIVTKDLTPSDTVQMTGENVLAFAMDKGGITSHAAIIARSLRIPAVVGLVDATSNVQTGEYLIIDGTKGIVITNPGEKTLSEYRKSATNMEN